MENKKELGGVDAFFDLVDPKKIIAIIICFVIMAVVVKLITKLSKKIEDSNPAYRLVSLQIATMASFSIYIFGTFGVIYAVIRPPKELLLAVGGSAAVAIGFALKDLVSSIIAGLILLFDRPFQVGDRVSFGGEYGQIVSIGLRAVRLVTLDDSLVTIPNSKFLTDLVSSGNAGALDMMICVDFILATDTDLRKARDLLYEVVATSKYVFIRKSIDIVFTEKSEAQFHWIEVKVKAYVLDVIYEKAFQTDIVLRGNEVLNLNKIKRPSVSLAMSSPQEKTL